MFYIVYYLKGSPDHCFKPGFRTREMAWNWLQTFIDEVDSYQIYEEED